jgi:hypothetical protein
MEGSGQLHAPAALSPGKELPVPIGYETGWAPEPIWTRCSCRELNSSRPARRIISILTELPRLLFCRKLRGVFEKFVDWRQCAAVMQRETVTIMSICSGGGNVVVVISLVL